MIGVVIDRFGQEVKVRKADDMHLEQDFMWQSADSFTAGFVALEKRLRLSSRQR